MKENKRTDTAERSQKQKKGLFRKRSHGKPFGGGSKSKGSPTSDEEALATHKPAAKGSMRGLLTLKGKSSPIEENPRAKGSIRGLMHTITGKSSPNEEDINLRYAEGLLKDMDSKKRISIDGSFLSEFSPLEQLHIGEGVTPLHSLVAATASIIDKRDKPHATGEQFTLEREHINKSSWATLFEGFIISVERDAGSDANDSNIKLILQVLAKRGALKNSELQPGQFSGEITEWPPGQGRIPDEPLVQDVMSPPGFKNMLTDFKRFIGDYYKDEYFFNRRDTSKHVAKNGYTQFSRDKPIQPDNGLAFQKRDGSAYYYVMVEEYKKLGYGIGMDILHKYAGHHNVDIEASDAALQQFCENNKLRRPVPNPMSLIGVSFQAGVQAISLESRVFGISDGAVYAMFHISGNQDIDSWPLDCKNAVTWEIQDGKKHYKEALLEEWEHFPRLICDKIDIVTNEQDMMKLRASVMANELFRIFPRLKDFCQEYLKGGDEAARQFALSNELLPSEDYVNQLRPFYSRMKEIVHRRLGEAAVEGTQGGIIMYAGEFSNVKSLCAASAGRSSAVFRVQFQGKYYILKVYDLNDAGLLGYTSEWYAYNRRREKGIDVMVEMFGHGRLNGGDHISNGPSYDDDLLVASVLANLKLQSPIRRDLRNANKDAPFFILMGVARGRSADFDKASDRKLIGGAYKKLRKAGIQLPEFDESNFIIDKNDNIKAIDFAMGLDSDEDGEAQV